MTQSIVERARTLMNCNVESDAKDYAQALLVAVEALEKIKKAAKWTDIYQTANAALKKIGVSE